MMTIKDEFCYPLPEDGYNQLVQAAEALDVLTLLMFEANNKTALDIGKLSSLISYAANDLCRIVRMVDEFTQAT